MLTGGSGGFGLWSLHVSVENIFYSGTILWAKHANWQWHLL